MRLVAIVLLFLLAYTVSGAQWPPGPQIPEQIHLAHTGVITEMVVTYITIDECDQDDQHDPVCQPQGTPTSTCQYGITRTGLISSTVGDQFTYHDGGDQKRNMSVHTIKLTNLKADTRYFYRVGDETYGWSAIYTFKTLVPGTPKVDVIMYADVGDWNGQQTIPYLQNHVQLDEDVDMIIHSGDFAYDMATDNARAGDRFLNDIQNVAAYVPYQVAPGNHENHYNYSNYRAKFWAPGEESKSYTNLYCSFPFSTIRFIAISTEIYYDDVNYDMSHVETQYRWLEATLQQAVKERKYRPWIIVYGHRPIYFAYGQDPNLILGRKDTNGTRKFGLEDLFLKYDVDIYFAGHVHNYQRMYPTARQKVVSKSYSNAAAPIYLISGAGGSSEGISNCPPQKQLWTVTCVEEYGYARLIAYNGTTIHWQQIGPKESIIDSVWITKE